MSGTLRLLACVEVFEKVHIFYFQAEIDKQNGFILFTILFFLCMIGLLVLTSLNSTQLALRMSQNYAMASQQFQAAEAGLSIAEERLATLLQKESFHDEMNYAGYQVHYDVRRLSPAFCFEKNLAYYYRITAQAKPTQGRAVVLQSTYAKKINDRCKGKEKRLLQEGRSSWRELNV